MIIMYVSHYMDCIKINKFLKNTLPTPLSDYKGLPDFRILRKIFISLLFQYICVLLKF